MANQAGKRYECEACGTQFIVTKGGTGDISCHGAPMVRKN